MGSIKQLFFYVAAVGLSIVSACATQDIPPTATPPPTSSSTPSAIPQPFGVRFTTEFTDGIRSSDIEISRFTSLIPAAWLAETEDSARYNIHFLAAENTQKDCGEYGQFITANLTFKSARITISVRDLETGSTVSIQSFRGVLPLSCPNTHEFPTFNGLMMDDTEWVAPDTAEVRTWFTANISGLPSMPPTLSPTPTRTPTVTHTPSPTPQAAGVRITTEMIGGISASDVNLDRITDQIPSSWLSEDDEFARYEIQFSLRQGGQKTCGPYGQSSFSFNQAELIYKRAVITVSITDLTTDSQVASQEFQRELPSTCPDTHQFSTIGATGTLLDDTEWITPAASAIIAWLIENLSGLPAMPPTSTPSPTRTPSNGSPTAPWDPFGSTATRTP